MEAQGSRLAWEDVADHIRQEVAIALGSAVIHAENQPGGFSPGVAARCELADGRRCFIKAVSTAQNPDSPEMHRREATITSRLPSSLPVPQLLRTVDDGDWVVLVLEEVVGRTPRLPWSLPDLAATFAAVRELWAAATPCPVPDLPTFAERHVEVFAGWRRLAAGHVAVDEVDPWSRRNLARLAEMEAEWEPAATGASLLHSDLRADNLIVRPDGSVVVVDWPHACVGAPWVDLVLMLPSVGLDGGPSPRAVEEALDPFADADAEAVDLVLVGLAGFFTVKGFEPDPPGLPTVRAFQRAQGAVARAWLAARLGLD